jgi:hypothetical protein
MSPTTLPEAAIAKLLGVSSQAVILRSGVAMKHRPRTARRPPVMASARLDGRDEEATSQLVYPVQAPLSELTSFVHDCAGPGANTMFVKCWPPPLIDTTSPTRR